MRVKKSVARAVGAMLLPLSMVQIPAASAAENLQWGPCPEAASAAPDAQCADFEVPKDHANPQAGNITLTMSKIPAGSGHAKGTIAGNPGGPGGDALGMFAGNSGNDDHFEDRVKFPAEVRANYDQIAVEPRGLAFGEPLTCEFDEIPLGNLALGLAGGLSRELCNIFQPGYIDTITTDNTARDLEVARQKLGVDKLNLYGVSYGGLLMSSYATQFPQHTDRTVLDSSSGQNRQWADLSDRGPERRDSLYTMFQWIADHNDEYGLGTTALQVYQRWSKQVETEVGVPAELTPPPAQVGDLPPGIAEHSGVALPVVNQALPAAWRLFSAMHTVLKGKAGATGASPLFAYTYYQGLYDESEWGNVAKYIRDGKPEGPEPELPEDEEVLKDVMRMQMSMGLVERGILCNENRRPIHGERLIPELIESYTGGDIINSIENSFTTGQNCIGWPLPKPAMNVNGDKLETKPLLLGFSNDNAVGGGSIWDMQRRMGGEAVVLDGHSHGVLVAKADEVAPKVNSYFGA